MFVPVIAKQDIKCFMKGAMYFLVRLVDRWRTLLELSAFKHRDPLLGSSLLLVLDLNCGTTNFYAWLLLLLKLRMFLVNWNVRMLFECH